MGQKKFAKGFILGIVLTLVVGGAGMKVYDVVEDRQSSKNAVNDEFVEKAKLIEEIVDEKYTGEVDKELMEADMYKGMMASLKDPYSAYYTAEEYEE
ncbi:MAG TPA: carboxy- processing protease, partial [Candidatus Blautia stercoravium]|nr:carboxy- processing protease [Candidatus Blautia stercoravium]